MRCRVYTDGASRGNPGPAAVGVSIENDAGEEIAAVGEVIGTATNNVAEYRALYRALEELDSLGADQADFHLDSQLVVRQLSGEYRVRDPKMAEWFTQVRRRLHNLDKYTIKHIPRDENTRADALANQALDEQAAS